MCFTEDILFELTPAWRAICASSVHVSRGVWCHDYALCWMCVSWQKGRGLCHYCAAAGLINVQVLQVGHGGRRYIDDHA